MAKTLFKLPVIGKVTTTTVIIAAAAWFFFFRKPTQPTLPQ